MHDAILHLDLPVSEASGPLDAALPRFVVGPENRVLAPVVQRLLDGHDLAAAAQLFNPLALVGPPGSGKSHLVQGLVRHWRRRLEVYQVGYFTAADLGREYQSAAADGRLPQWRGELRNLQLLVVEGLERFRRGGAAQRELRQVVDAVVDQGGMVVVTAEREPAALVQLEPAFRDRLAAGLTVRLAQPHLDARRAILTLAAESRGIALPAETLDALARPEVAAAGQLLDRLQPESGQEETEPHDPADARSSLKQILAVAARYFGVTQAALVGPSRRKSLVAARNAVVHLARRLTPLSYEQIGQGLGGRDHTTIMHAQRRLAESLTTDPAAQQAIDELERIIRC